MNGGADCIPGIDARIWTDPMDAAALGYLDDDDRVLGLIGSSPSALLTGVEVVEARAGLGQ